MVYSQKHSIQTPGATALYSTGEPAFAVNRKGKIVTWNRAAETVFGYSADKAAGQRCCTLLCGRDIYGNEYCSHACPLRTMAFRGHSVNSFRIFFKTSAQELNPFRVTTLMLSTAPGKELLVHICRPEIEVLTNPITQRSTTQPSNNQKRGALTQREREVLALIAEGKATREIASVMCISVYTVRNHIGHILFKLNVHSRLEAISLGRRLLLV